MENQPTAKNRRKSPAPALSRGIQVLNLLTAPTTADELVRMTRIPKTTVLRILTTLQMEGLVTRNDATRTFLASIRISPRESTGDEFEDLLDGTLARLARATGHTAEWYLPVAGGQVLSRRYVPKQSEVQVRSWIGEVKNWTGLLDAVTCAGRVWWNSRPEPGENLWVFGSLCERVNLGMEEANRLMDEALERGYCVDNFFNPRGIRRVATTVWGKDQPVGVLAIAHCNLPNLDAQIENNISILLRETLVLTAEAARVLHRVERRSPEENKDDARTKWV